MLQDDLKTLEIRLHVLKAVPKAKGGWGNEGGVAKYAREMGVSRPSLNDWIYAAEVAKADGQPSRLIKYTTCLSIIHRVNGAGRTFYPSIHL